MMKTNQVQFFHVYWYCLCYTCACGAVLHYVKHCTVVMNSPAELSGHQDLEPLELLESDNYSIRSYEVQYTMSVDLVFS